MNGNMIVKFGVPAISAFYLGISLVTSFCHRDWTEQDQRCYNTYQHSLAWQQASGDCIKMNGTLVNINDLAEQTFIMNRLQKGLAKEHWIGLWRNESTWQWTDTADILFNKLDLSNASSERGCAAIASDGRWIPTACYIDLPYICERGSKAIKYPTMTGKWRTVQPTPSTISLSDTKFISTAILDSSVLTTTPASMPHAFREEKRLIVRKCIKRNATLVTNCLMEHGFGHTDLCEIDSEIMSVSSENVSLLLKGIIGILDRILTVDTETNVTCNVENILYTLEHLTSLSQNILEMGPMHYIMENIEYHSDIINSEDLPDFKVVGEGVACMVSNISIDTIHEKPLSNLSASEKDIFLSVFLIIASVPVEKVIVEDRDQDSSYFLVSPIMSLSSRMNETTLPMMHTFTMYHRQENDLDRWTNIEAVNGTTTTILCAFYKLLDRVWSTRGCQLVVSHDSVATCQCNHTTSFAVLMKVTEFEISEENKIALSVITYIGCSVSILTMFIALTVFTCVRSLASERVFVHRNMCLAILLSQVAFLAGIRALKNQAVCRGVAFILHYLYTCTFMWMLVEGLHLYTKVVQVFGTEKSRGAYYLFFGWGIPVILATVSASTGWEGYGTDKSCWLSVSRQTIWAFVGPALAILIVNIVILVMVLKIVVASAKINRNGKFDHIRAGAKGAMFLLPLLGLSWIFGIMAVNKDLLVFEYLFAVFNSLQGFFIFLFHCACNTEVRQALHRLREKMALQLELTTNFSSDDSEPPSLQGPETTLHLKAEYIDGVKLYRPIEVKLHNCPSESVGTMSTQVERKRIKDTNESDTSTYAQMLGSANDNDMELLHI